MKLLTMTEAADYLQLRREYLRRLSERGRGPVYVSPTPKLRLYRQDDLDAWRDTWRVHTAPQVKQHA